MWTPHKGRAKTRIYTNIHKLIEFVYYMYSEAHKLAARGAGTKMRGATTWGRSNRIPKSKMHRITIRSGPCGNKVGSSRTRG